MNTAREFEEIWKLTDVNWSLRSKYEFAEAYAKKLLIDFSRWEKVKFEYDHTIQDNVNEFLKEQQKK